MASFFLSAMAACSVLATWREHHLGRLPFLGPAMAIGTAVVMAALILFGS